MSEDSTMTMISDKYEEESLSHHIRQSISVTEVQTRSLLDFILISRRSPRATVSLK